MYLFATKGAYRNKGSFPQLSRIIQKALSSSKISSTTLAYSLIFRYFINIEGDKRKVRIIVFRGHKYPSLHNLNIYDANLIFYFDSVNF